MACFYPQTVYPSKEVNPSGKRSATWNPNQGYSDLGYEIACGQCQGCRATRALDWATRITHESLLWESNLFLTLTYDEGQLPLHGTLDYSDHELFMKRLRKRFAPRTIRYYSCGEYGETTLRPHFHTCLFNLSFNDAELWKTQNGEHLFTSPTLNEIWGKGRAVIGSLTYASAAYVARYILKKITGPKSELHYQLEHPITGDIHQAAPEGARMSQSLGISWLEKFKSDVYPKDFFHIDGKKIRPPRAYDRWLEKHDPQMWARVRARRQVGGEANSENNTYERLRVREHIHALKSEYYRRIYEA